MKLSQLATSVLVLVGLLWLGAALALFEAHRLKYDPVAGISPIDLVVSLTIGAVLVASMFVLVLIAVGVPAQIRDARRLRNARRNFPHAFIHEYYASIPFCGQLAAALRSLNLKPTSRMPYRSNFALVVEPDNVRILAGGGQYRTPLVLPATEISRVSSGTCKDKAFTYSSVDIELKTPLGPQVIQLLELSRSGIWPRRGNGKAIDEQAVQLRSILRLDRAVVS